MVVVRARGLEYVGREFESRCLHLKPETKLGEERGLSGCRKGLKTVPLAQALLSLKPTKQQTKDWTILSNKSWQLFDNFKHSKTIPVMQLASMDLK